MILIDTSVWIEFFRGREPFHGGVRSLLEIRQALTMECVFAELLQGAKAQRERTLIQEMWESLPKIDDPESLLQAGRMAGLNRWPERGIGLIDAWILVSARLAKARIWSLDKKLNSLLSPAEFYSLQSLSS